MTGRADIVPLTIHAPGTQGFEICSTFEDDTIIWPLKDYIRANPNFKAEGWGRLKYTRLHICPHGRRHWKVERVAP